MLGFASQNHRITKSFLLSTGTRKKVLVVHSLSPAVEGGEDEDLSLGLSTEDFFAHGNIFLSFLSFSQFSFSYLPANKTWGVC